MADRKFRRGDVVQFRAGTRTIQGVVKEDRGPLGLKGRHLYLIDYGPDVHAEGAPSQIELPAAELELVAEKHAIK
jgi:hypothetical protein